MVNITDTKITITNGLDEIIYLEFSNINDNTIDVLHVVANDKYKGQGYGKVVMEELIKYLELNNKKAKLTCPFAVAYSLKHPELDKYFIK